MHLAKWNRMTGKQRDRWNSVQTNVNWCSWKEGYTKLRRSGLIAASQKCDLGIVPDFHTNAGLIFLRCWSLAALCKSLPTCCPSACQRHSNLEQNLSHQHLTHNQKWHLYTLRSKWQKTPRVCQDYTNNNFRDWQCTGQVFVEMMSGLNRAQHQSVCTFWKATRVLHVLKKARTV